MQLQELAKEEHAALVLSRAMDRGRLHHDYLICASDIAEAESLVRVFFAACNCEPMNGLECCGECPTCEAILDPEREYPELMLFDATQQKLGIDEVRTIEGRLSHYINQGRARGIIIRGMERLTTEAQNCLLKIVEEPPEATYFFFITTNINGVLLTIRSRCQILRLSPAPLTVAQITAGNTNLEAISELLLKAATKSIEAVMEAAQQIPENRFEASIVLDLLELRLRDILAGRAGLSGSDYICDQDWLNNNGPIFADIPAKRLFSAQNILAKGRRYRDNNINCRLLGESVILSLINQADL